MKEPTPWIEAMVARKKGKKITIKIPKDISIKDKLKAIIKLQEKTCPNCSKDFETYSQHKKYCSPQCLKEYTRELAGVKDYGRLCENCGEYFETSIPHQAYCCKECLRQSRRIEVSESYGTYREYLLETANFKCEECNKETNDLCIHHIFPLYKGGKDELINLQVLCNDCHMKKHKIKSI